MFIVPVKHKYLHRLGKAFIVNASKHQWSVFNAIGLAFR